MPSSLLSLSSAGSSQTCMDSFNISENFEVFTVEGGVRTCFRCLFGGAVNPSTTWTLNSVLISSSDGTVTDGVLTIFDPTMLVPEIRPTTQLTCITASQQYTVFLRRRGWLDSTNLGCAYKLLSGPLHAV